MTTTRRNFVKAGLVTAVGLSLDLPAYLRRAWAAEPLKLTGLPAKQDIAINNAVLHLTVEASDLAGYATASLSVCGKG